MKQARLAQSVEHETLNLRVVGSSPTLGAKVFGYNIDWTKTVKKIPTARLELAIFGLGDRRLIHWATRASLPSDQLFCSKNGNHRAYMTILPSTHTKYSQNNVLFVLICLD